MEVVRCLWNNLVLESSAPYVLLVFASLFEWAPAPWILGGLCAVAAARAAAGSYGLAVEVAAWLRGLAWAISPSPRLLGAVVNYATAHPERCRGGGIFARRDAVDPELGAILEADWDNLWVVGDRMMYDARASIRSDYGTCPIPALPGAASGAGPVGAFILAAGGQAGRPPASPALPAHPAAPSPLDDVLAWASSLMTPDEAKMVLGVALRMAGAVRSEPGPPRR